MPSEKVDPTAIPAMKKHAASRRTDSEKPAKKRPPDSQYDKEYISPSVLVAQHAERILKDDASDRKSRKNDRYAFDGNARPERIDGKIAVQGGFQKAVAECRQKPTHPSRKA